MKRTYIYILAVAFMAFVAVAFFYPDDIDGRQLAQHDMQQGLANGHEGQLFHEQTGESTRWTNSLFSGMPNFQIAPSYAATPWLSWIARAYGLWLPSPASLLMAMMLGFFIMGMCMQMRWYVALFGAIAWAFSTYFIIIIGAGHIWKFVTLSYIPPTIGGIWLCYRGRYLWGTTLAALFGALQLMANHIQMSYYFLFVVLALMVATFISLWREGRLRQWLIASACIFGAGSLAIAANCASLYNTAQYAKETVRGRATELSTPKGGGEAKAQGGADFDYITAWSYGGGETMTLLVPNAKGGATIKPVAGDNQMLTVDALSDGNLSEQDSYVAQQFPQYFGDQPMTNGPVYVGAFVLVLAILALCICRGPLRWCLLAVSLLATFLAWGYNFEWLSRMFIDYFPGYNKFRTVSSMLVVVEFTLPLLAMMALMRILQVCKAPSHKERTERVPGTPADGSDLTPDALCRRLLWVSGLSALLCLLLWLFPSLMGSGLSAGELKMVQEQDLMADPAVSGALQTVKELRLSLVSTDALRSLIFILCGTAIVWLYIKGKYREGFIMVGGVLILCVLDLFFVNKRYVDSANFTDADTAAATFEPNAADQLILQDTAQNYRVMDVDGFSQARSSYFHKTIGGYHAAKLTRYNDLLEHQIQKNNMGVLNMLNTKYVMGMARNEQGQPVADLTGQPQWTAQLNPDALGNAWWVERIDYVDTPDAEMAALDTLNTARHAVADRKFSATLGTALPVDSTDYIRETTYAPNALTYHTHSRNGGVAVFSEVYFPWGWTATVDGQEVPISRVNYVLRGLRIPAGDHTVAFRFEPKSLAVADSISVGAVIAIYALGILSLVGILLIFLRRKKQE